MSKAQPKAPAAPKAPEVNLTPEAQDAAANQPPVEAQAPEAPVYPAPKPTSPHYLPDTEHGKINEIDSFLGLPTDEAIAGVEAVSTAFSINAVEEYRQSLLTWLRNE